MPTTLQRAALKSNSSVSRSIRTPARAQRKPGTRILVTANTGAQRRRLAESVSKELNRELCRIDVGKLTSKYIGETEKRLRSLFDSGESRGAILFFEEADALFGKRTKVKDANDRYANQEVGYLLQRMEDSPSVIILATSNAKNIDAAFLRRLRVAIKLTVPTATKARSAKTTSSVKSRDRA